MHPKKHPFVPLNLLVSSEWTINQMEHRQPCTKAVTPAFWCTGAIASCAVDRIHHFPMFSCVAWIGSRHPLDQLLLSSLQCELCPNNMVLLHQHCAIEQCYQSKPMLFGTSWCTLLLGGHCLCLSLDWMMIGIGWWTLHQCPCLSSLKSILGSDKLKKVSCSHMKLTTKQCRSGVKLNSHLKSQAHNQLHKN